MAAGLIVSCISPSEGPPSTPGYLIVPTRTDATVHRVDACDSIGIGNPVRGRLNIEAGETFAVVALRSSADELLHVVWPSGFAVVLGSPAALVNDRWIAVAADGDVVELTQVSVDDHAGSDDDPYIVLGLFAGECWSRRRT